jgi:hypothetical protein
MIIGIVGSEAAKFTPDTEEAAKEMLRGIILFENAETIVSGACHLGGIDRWAIEIAIEMGRKPIEFPPKYKSWRYGYKPRNIRIAKSSDKVYCLTVKEYPPGYMGMRFNGCYHCGTPADHHVKSGGCWTIKYAARIGKATQLVIIQ